MPATDFLDRLAALPADKRQAYVNRYFPRWADRTDFPITIGNRAIFVYRGAAHTVAMVGDTTHWSRPIPLKRIEGTDIFTLEQRYEPDARLDYKLDVGGRRILDPLNPCHIRSGFGQNCELRMPEYQPHPEADYNRGIQHGTLQHHTLYSYVLRERRPYHLYLPHGWDKKRAYPILYFQDGQEYIKLAQARHILDATIAEGRLPPMVAVFVDPIVRNREYATNDRYVRFFHDELMPRAESHFTAAKSKRILVGASLGGLISLYLAYRYPRLFSGVLSHSGAFSWSYADTAVKAGTDLFCDRISTEPLPLRVFLAVGSYERHVVVSDLVASNQRLFRDLRRNPTVRAAILRLYPQGHSWGLWRDTLAEGLQWLMDS